ncbi:MAG TPA: methyltransferase [Bryobacteraceae bacterium]|nr:methyltransferase [Bryobacteraceae bacterium]
MTDGFPLRMASAETFAAVRDFLRSSGYTEDFLLERFQVPGIHVLLTPFGLAEQYLGLKYRGDGLPIFLARTLFGGFLAAREEAERYLPTNVSAALFELGILEAVPGDNARVRTTVLLHPANGIFVAADRGFWSEGIAYSSSDFVMSGIENLSRRYFDCVSKSPCRTFLEVGTGAGYGALAATAFADHVWATDITERAVRYAAFNRELNAAKNMEVLQGDLFAPVAGMRFDRIACHPPFEPALKQDFVFSIGGEDGEAIISRVVAEAPAYLEPGGRLYCQVIGTDRYEEPLEARVCKWLGTALEECDVALFVRFSCKPMEYATEQVLAENSDAWKLQEWSLLYQKLKAEQVVIGQLVLQKPKSPRAVFRTRRSFGPKTGIAEMDALLDWETRCVEPGFAAWMLRQRPAQGQGWELYVRHTMKSGSLAAFSHTFFSQHPFETNLHCSPWMPVMVSRCDGMQSFEDHLAWLQRRMALHEEEFLRAAGALVSSDILRLA